VSAAAACPCGSGRRLAACCGPLHAGAPAASAEALMRSRYSAFVLGRVDYLLASWHPSTRPPALRLDTPAPFWLGLEVRRAWRIDDWHAGVEFVARCRIGGAPALRQHERSRFVFEDGRWYYLDAAG
jgi:SEC-C motif domain protein